MKKTWVLVSMAFAATLAFAMPGGGGPVAGKVLETADGGTYIYIKLQTSEGQVWAATTKQEIPTGAQVVIHDPMLMTNFQSKALNRTFDQIVFGSAVSVESDQTAASSKAQMAAAHMANANAASNVPVAKVAKAVGPSGRTVAEVHAQKAQLAGTKVDVRGQVVKFSADIMDRNWIHLRDGTGSADAKSNDLLVTTKQTAKVGDVILVTGPVKTDVNYGSGYAYPVVIDAATLQK